MKILKSISITLFALVIFTNSFQSVAFAASGNIDLPGIVSQSPAAWTPQVPGGWSNVVEKQYQVMSMQAHNGMMYVGGNFPTVVTSTGSALPLNHANIFAMDPKTGLVSSSFNPIVNKEVSSVVGYVEPGTNKSWIYIGGKFTKVNGVPMKYLAKIDANTGKLDPAFVSNLDGPVNDLEIMPTYLAVGGKFTTVVTPVGSFPRAGLVALSRGDGAVYQYLDMKLFGTISVTNPNTGIVNTCTTSVEGMAVSADGSKMAVQGCFTNVGGAGGPHRTQLFLIDLTSTQAKLSNWAMPKLDQLCPITATYINGIDFAPVGTRLFVGTTGGTNNKDKLCDAAFAVDSAAVGTNVQPLWVSSTGINTGPNPGADTITAVQATTKAVYIAGHFRGVGNSAGVYTPRSGLAALDPATGSLMPWDPGHDRELGGRDLTLTNSAQQGTQYPTGLWYGSDSGGCGKNVGETLNHEGLCFFPSL